jgi:hypothetical protein
MITLHLRANTAARKRAEANERARREAERERAAHRFEGLRIQLDRLEQEFNRRQNDAADAFSIALRRSHR